MSGETKETADGVGDEVTITFKHMNGQTHEAVVSTVVAKGLISKNCLSQGDNLASFWAEYKCTRPGS